MMNNIPGIEEVNMFRDDGHVAHFNNPKVQASLAANTFAITGHAETKLVTEFLPQIINQLGPDSLRHLYPGAGRGKDGGVDDDDDGIGGILNGGHRPHPGTIVEDDDEDVPELVDNFDAPSKNESKVGDGGGAAAEEDGPPPLVELAAPTALATTPTEVVSPEPVDTSTPAAAEVTEDAVETAAAADTPSEAPADTPSEAPADTPSEPPAETLSAAADTVVIEAAGETVAAADTPAEPPAETPSAAVVIEAAAETAAEAAVETSTAAPVELPPPAAAVEVVAAAAEEEPAAVPKVEDEPE